MENITNQDRQIASTILDQMGGARRIGIMIGATLFQPIGSGVSFTWKARGKQNINACTITLEPSDTYKVSFKRIRAGQIKVIETFDDVYNDSLKELFERTTGLYLSL